MTSSPTGFVEENEKEKEVIDGREWLSETSPSDRLKESDERKRLEKKLLRKLDLRMSIIVVIYILNYIDKTNVTAARLQGFEEDLHLEGQQYATLLSITYVGYIIMQVPSNMFMNWVARPSIFLPTCMAVWGLISILTGITQNYRGVLVARFFLGFVEAPFFPGALFLISRWYKRDEIGVRSAVVSCGSLFSTGFGALIASGILQGMQNKLGHAAWRWLFYIEGSVTIFVAICAVFILPDFPHNTRWLTPEERELAISRLAEDVNPPMTSSPDSTESSSQHLNNSKTESPFDGFKSAMSDWKVWWFAGAATAQIFSQSFYIYFPTLSATMGFGTTVSLLLCAPPWVWSVIAAFGASRHSDVTKRRFVYVAVSNTIGIAGFVIAICTMNVAARYISLFMMTQMYAALIVFYAWMSNAFAREPAKRAVALAFMNASSQLGNVAGSYVWPTTWGPTYRYSYAVCIGGAALSTGMFGVMFLHLRAVNRGIEKAEREGKGSVGLKYII
ncbi:hypothetical protein HYDPIDRAFT_41826 [Hydnomerulius pinastri MD-312]|uniref:Major facilitator superfamily (MFS) profile domain-containing protein n=1 Tax=Hydnomerulius pinastri MD-312 TaxID=994086 RepID=A0A0C9WD39_9AGAM|nr:hypothetical protein HYDPIDRAFT_41826 [Hydnomerulius pinastri MD-312]